MAQNKSIIVILGHTNDQQGQLSDIAKARLDLAIEVLRLHSHTSILLTGGFGEHFNQTHTPHAEYAAQYLLSQGVSHDLLIQPFVFSRNTIEDGQLAAPVLQQYHPNHILLVTSDFHMPRALFIFEHQCPGMKIHCFTALSPVSAEQYAALTAHENKRLSQLKNQGIV